MIYQVSHTTTYKYSDAVTLCYSESHLRPRDTPTQECHAFSFTIEPTPCVSTHRLDYFGNHVQAFSIQEQHKTLTVISASTVEVAERAPNAQAMSWEQARDAARNDRSPEGLDACQYVFDSPFVRCSAELTAYAAHSFTPGRELQDALIDLTRRIHADFAYDTKATSVATPIEQVFRERRGVCQDFAHLQLGCLRSLGLPARYVSGYLVTQSRAGESRVRGADASHAWVSAWCPGAGWIDLDPTNPLLPAGRHLTLAWGRDFADVSPIKGVIHGGGPHTLEVSVDVSPA